MTTRAQLEKALVAQESLRGTLPDEVVDVAVFALRQQLAKIAPIAPDEQRKLVTVLFADLVGWTQMAEQMDPEDVQAIQRAYFAAVTPAIEQHGGSVEKYIGDAVLAVFGVPQSHEDDPERAVRVALAMQEAWGNVKSIERKLPPMRIGIHTGLVISAVDAVGGFVVTGDTVNLASRLQSVARPGAVLISEQTHKLVAHAFETEKLKAIQVKGKDEPVLAFQVVAARAKTSKLRGIAGLESPLVGREAEFAALQQALDRLMAGEGGIVTIVGDAGIGKSRLVAELRQLSISNTQLTIDNWIEGLCPTHGGSIPYRLWVEMLHSALVVTLDDPPKQVGERLREWVEDLCPDHFDAVYPYLARLLSLPQQAEGPVALVELDGRQKQRTFKAAECAIASLAQRQPLILVCEDLHWSDPSSLELLHHFLPLTRQAPLLFILVSRIRRDHSAWNLLETISQTYPERHTALRLQPLSPTDSASLLANLLHIDALPPAQRALILSRTEGNPFYVEEIIRSLMDRGVIIQDAISGRCQVTQEVTETTIPDTLNGVLMARIDQLPRDVRRVLQLAAVVGRFFPYRVLAATMPEASQLNEHLLTLQQEQMIVEQANATEVEFKFRYNLTQEAAYNSLLKKERRAYHKLVAQALEQLYPDRLEEQAGLLAHHWARSGETDRAIGYALMAGDRSYRLGASQEAIEFYQSALQTATTSESPDRMAAMIQAHERLGDVYLVNLSRHAEAFEHYQAFLALSGSDEAVARGARKLAGVHLLLGDLQEARKQYDIALTHLDTMPTTAETGRVHYGLAYLHSLENRMDEAERHARTGFEASLQTSDLRGLADASRAMSGILKQKGDLKQACDYDEKSLEIYRELGDLPRTAQACNNVGDCYRLLGQMNQALAYINEGIELTRRIGDTRDEAILLCTLAELRLDQGRWDRAIAHIEKALPLAEASGAIARMVEVHTIWATACRGAEKWTERRQHLEEAEKLCQDAQLTGLMPRIYLEMAYLHASKGEFTRAESCIRSARQFADPGQHDAFLGQVHRCYGYLHNRQHNWDKAVENLELSLAAFEKTQLQTEIAKTRLNLVAAYIERVNSGDKMRALKHLLAAQSVFQNIDAPGRLAQVQMQMKTIERFSNNSTQFPGREK